MDVGFCMDDDVDKDDTKQFLGNTTKTKEQEGIVFVTTKDSWTSMEIYLLEVIRAPGIFGNDREESGGDGNFSDYFGGGEEAWRKVLQIMGFTLIAIGTLGIFCDGNFHEFEGETIQSYSSTIYHHRGRK